MWWPGDVSSPRRYIELRHRQLTQACRAAASASASFSGRPFWRAPEAPRGASALAQRRGLGQLAVKLPKAFTNVSGPEATVELVGSCLLGAGGSVVYEEAAQCAAGPAPDLGDRAADACRAQRAPAAEVAGSQLVLPHAVSVDAVATGAILADVRPSTAHAAAAQAAGHAALDPSRPLTAAASAAAALAPAGPLTAAALAPMGPLAAAASAASAAAASAAAAAATAAAAAAAAAARAAPVAVGDAHACLLRDSGEALARSRPAFGAQSATFAQLARAPTRASTGFPAATQALAHQTSLPASLAAAWRSPADADAPRAARAVPSSKRLRACLDENDLDENGAEAAWGPGFVQAGAPAAPHQGYAPGGGATMPRDCAFGGPAAMSRDVAFGAPTAMPCDFAQSCASAETLRPRSFDERAGCCVAPRDACPGLPAYLQPADVRATRGAEPLPVAQPCALAYAQGCAAARGLSLSGDPACAASSSAPEATHHARQLSDAFGSWSSSQTHVRDASFASTRASFTSIASDVHLGFQAAPAAWDAPFADPDYGLGRSAASLPLRLPSQGARPAQGPTAATPELPRYDYLLRPLGPGVEAAGSAGEPQGRDPASQAPTQPAMQISGQLYELPSAAGHASRARVWEPSSAAASYPSCGQGADLAQCAQAASAHGAGQAPCGCMPGAFGSDPAPFAYATSAHGADPACDLAAAQMSAPASWDACWQPSAPASAEAASRRAPASLSQPSWAGLRRGRVSSGPERERRSIRARSAAGTAVTLASLGSACAFDPKALAGGGALPPAFAPLAAAGASFTCGLTASIAASGALPPAALLSSGAPPAATSTVQAASATALASASLPQARQDVHARAGSAPPASGAALRAPEVMRGDAELPLRGRLVGHLGSGSFALSGDDRRRVAGADAGGARFLERGGNVSLDGSYLGYRVGATEVWSGPAVGEARPSAGRPTQASDAACIPRQAAARGPSPSSDSTASLATNSAASTALGDAVAWAAQWQHVAAACAGGAPLRAASRPTFCAAPGADEPTAATAQAAACWHRSPSAPSLRSTLGDRSLVRPASLPADSGAAARLGGSATAQAHRSSGELRRLAPIRFSAFDDREDASAATCGTAQPSSLRQPRHWRGACGAPQVAASASLASAVPTASLSSSPPASASRAPGSLQAQPLADVTYAYLLAGADGCALGSASTEAMDVAVAARSSREATMAEGDEVAVEVSCGGELVFQDALMGSAVADEAIGYGHLESLAWASGPAECPRTEAGPRRAGHAACDVAPRSGGCGRAIGERPSPPGLAALASPEPATRHGAPASPPVWLAFDPLRSGFAQEASGDASDAGFASEVDAARTRAFVPREADTACARSFAPLEAAFRPAAAAAVGVQAPSAIAASDGAAVQVAPVAAPQPAPSALHGWPGSLRNLAGRFAWPLGGGAAAC